MARNIGALSVAKLVETLTRLVKAKLNAVFLGVEGLGIFSQLLTFTAKTSQFSQLSINEALVKQVAVNKLQPETKKYIYASIKAYLLIVPALFALLMTVLVVFYEQIANFFLGDNPQVLLYFFALSALPIMIVNGLFFAILRGYKDIKSITKARIGAALINIIIFVPLVLIFDLQGVVFSIPMMYTINTTFNLFFLNKYILRKHQLLFSKVFKANIRKEDIKEMFIFSGFGLTTGFLAMASEFVIRGIIVGELGIEKIGVYSPILALSGIFTGVFMSSFSTYLFPRISEAKIAKEKTDILNDAIRISTLALIPFVLLLISFRIPIIRLLYTTEFLDAALYLPFHFFGIIWQIWFVVLGRSMAPQGYVKQHGLFRGIFFLLDVVIVYIFVAVIKIGLYGWMLKFLISPVLFCFIYFFFLKKKIQFKISKENALVMSYLLFTTIMVIAFDLLLNVPLLNYIVAPVLIAMTFIVLRTKEQQYIFYRIKALLKKND
ncbi:oligosaccharide flippase family protein [Salinivirga cyanobacteriivorans]|nr:oligosaccharide flippase family protein [Salinivirga cyanobacteriivorans]